MANQLASRSIQRLDAIEINGSARAESPETPTSPTKKFSFKFSSRQSPKVERRHFSAEAASIADIQVRDFPFYEVFFSLN